MFGLFNLMGYRGRGVTTQQIMLEAIDLVKVAEQGGFERFGADLSTVKKELGWKY